MRGSEADELPGLGRKVEKRQQVETRELNQVAPGVYVDQQGKWFTVIPENDGRQNPYQTGMP